MFFFFFGNIEIFCQIDCGKIVEKIIKFYGFDDRISSRYRLSFTIYYFRSFFRVSMGQVFNFVEIEDKFLTNFPTLLW